jgi:hypothetical protein
LIITSFQYFNVHHNWWERHLAAIFKYFETAYNPPQLLADPWVPVRLWRIRYILDQLSGSVGATQHLNPILNLILDDFPDSRIDFARIILIPIFRNIVVGGINQGVLQVSGDIKFGSTQGDQVFDDIRL